MDQEASDVNEKLGKRLRSARKAQGLSQTHVAKFLGVSFQQVGKYESGQNTMSVPVFLRVCKALNLRPSFVLEQVAGVQHNR
ncbi:MULTISPECIES: helix-turn-helix domain-containing protein [unclassified Rhizobium]|uniref:helix-turn-helix domain-containing protein n=1 Tax=unclassified Rhizobium TaxID=2613769 RepID=UPI000DD54F82